MASIVKANSSLTAGGLVQLDQERDLNNASEVSLRIKYMCLKSAAPYWSERLQPGAGLPLPPSAGLMPTLQQGIAKLMRPLTLETVELEIKNGLAYFDCTFEQSFDITESSTIELRTYEGIISYDYTVPGVSYTFSASTDYSFEYYAESMTISAEHTRIWQYGDTVLNLDRLYISAPLNVETNVDLDDKLNIEGDHAPYVEYKRTKTRTNKGTYKYSLTGTVKYRDKETFIAQPHPFIGIV